MISNKSTAKLYNKKLRELLPVLGERNTSTVFFALLQSGSIDPYTLGKEISTEQRNAFAVALYEYNDYYTRPHDWKTANEYYELALSYTEDPKLIEEIKTKIKKS